MTWTRIAACIGLTLLVPPQGLRAQADGGTPMVPSADATFVEHPGIRLDGRLDEEVWRSGHPLDGFVQRTPRPGATATEETLVRILYDREAIYFAFRLHDSRPDSLTAPLARRDVGFGDSDWATVFVDSYHDRRTAFIFSVNPRGVKRDILVYDDAREDYSWDAVWSAATHTDSLGWTAEFRIPFSQLRFDPERTTWGLNLGRYVARKDEQSYWSPWPPSAPGYVSSFGVLSGLSKLPTPRRFTFQPYAVGRLIQAPGAPGDPFHDPNRTQLDIGGDLQLGLTPGLTLTATVNPDFGQVEADPAVVNLTAFESFFSERRPFFVEGTDAFSFDTNGGDLFYSRRIGRTPQGSVPPNAEFSERPASTTILGAAKISGETASGWRVGLLDALTAPERGRFVDAEGNVSSVAVEPLTHYGIARVQRDFRQGRSAVGAILTATNRRIEEDRLDFLRSAAYVGGLDLRHRFGGGDYETSGYFVASTIRGSERAIVRAQREPERYFQRPDANHLDFAADRTSLTGTSAGARVARIGGGAWRWEVEGRFISPEFETDDLGFQRVADRISQGASVRYRNDRPGPIFRRWDLRLAEGTEWTFGGERVETSLVLSGRYQLASHWGGYGQILRRSTAVSPTALRGGPALVVPGYVRPVFWLDTDRRKALSGRLFVNWMREDETGGRSLDIRPSLRLRPSARSELSIGTSLERETNPWQYIGQEDSDVGSRYYFGRLLRTEYSAELRLNYTFTPELSLQMYAEPFVSEGNYDRFKEVRDPHAASFHNRFHRFTEDEIRFDPAARRYLVGPADQPDGSFRDPDFNVLRMNASAVFRWEYLPGSTLFLVWQHDQRDARTDFHGTQLHRLGELFSERGEDAFLIKVSHRLGS